MENGVDDTVFFQEVLPCKSSEQKVHPHRKDENKYYEAGLVYISSGEDHCQRIGKDQADHCADKCKQKCKPQSLYILRCCDFGKVHPGEFSVIVSQTIIEDHDQRNDNERNCPEKVWPCQETFAILQFLQPPHLQIPVFS